MKISDMKCIPILLTTFLFLFTNCTDTEKGENANIPENKDQKMDSKQLNISILLDLSDRLIQPLQPDQQVRDMEIISSIEQVLKAEMDEKGAYLSKGKMRIMLVPAPSNPSINNVVKKLRTDLSTMNNQEKKKIYDQLGSLYRSGLSIVYELIMKEKSWAGSDIWRFFKNDVRDLCIEKNYRNILVILTDGYIYHENSTGRIENRTDFITSPLLKRMGFHNNPNWEQKFEKGDYGLSKVDQSLEDLEVLVLEINPSENHKNDEDIIRAYWNKWLKEMNVKDYATYNTALPVNTKQRIRHFF